MTNIRSLLAQIATFEQQHRAGLTPPCSALAEFFETARAARQDVEAIDSGLTSPGAARVPSARPVALERFDGPAVELTARVPVAVMARAVLEQLGAAAS